MRLTEREFENLKISYAGSVAQKRLARGVRLNYPEAIALISAQCLELIRDGNHNLADIQQQAKKILGKNQVLNGIPQMIKEINIEATFPDGVKVVSSLFICFGWFYIVELRLLFEIQFVLIWVI
jgi:urease gamma subunit